MIKTLESIKPIEIDGEEYKLVYDDYEIDSPCSKCALYKICEELSDKINKIYYMICVEVGEEFKEKTGKYPYFIQIKNHE